MGGRELKEDVKKVQELTGASYDECYKAFVKNGHNIQKAVEQVKKNCDLNFLYWN